MSVGMWSRLCIENPSKGCPAREWAQECTRLSN